MQMIGERPEGRPIVSTVERQSMAKRIQVDMFDVQLGAALLTQFRNKDGGWSEFSQTPGLIPAVITDKTMFWARSSKR
jgi:hypothetical protein